MKILYCLHGTYNSGGMERIVTAKANWLTQNGHDVCIVTTEQNRRSDFFKLHNSIKRIDIDILYSSLAQTNPFKKYFFRTKKIKSHQKKLQEIVTNFKPDIIISTFGNEIGIIPKIKTNAIKIAELHFSRWYRLQLDRKGIWKYIDYFLTWLDSQNVKKYDRFVVLTKEDKSNWTNYNNLVVIPNFIDSISPISAQLNNHTMVAIGRLSYQKGFDRLIKAWNLVYKYHPDWKLEIYGAGEELLQLEYLIDSLGLKDTVYILPPTSNINAVYQRASALLLTSRYEGLPMVLLEAMANGVPPISFTCKCGPRDVITNNVNGLLIDEDDIKGLSDSINKIIENHSYRKQLGKNAHEHAKNYLKNNIMQIWEENK